MPLFQNRALDFEQKGRVAFDHIIHLAVLLIGIVEKLEQENLVFLFLRGRGHRDG